MCANASDSSCLRCAVMTTLFTATLSILAALAVTGSVRAAGPACKYNDLDFSALAGKSYNPADENGYSYDLTICAPSQTQCPNDPDGVITGMAVQTKGSGWLQECFVLGVYTDDTEPPSWGPYAPEGAALTMGNGSPAQCPDGMPRQLEVDFTCGKTESPSDSAIVLKNTGCQYIFSFPTCHACKGGCSGGGGGGGGGGGSGGGGAGGSGHFFGTFLWIFVGVFCAYCIGGVAYNVYRNQKKGLEAIPNREFWGSLPGYTKDGVVHTAAFVKSKTSGASGPATAITIEKGSDATVSYQNVDAYSPDA